MWETGSLVRLRWPRASPPLTCDLLVDASASPSSILLSRPERPFRRLKPRFGANQGNGRTGTKQGSDGGADKLGAPPSIVGVSDAGRGVGSESLWTPIAVGGNEEGQCWVLRSASTRAPGSASSRKSKKKKKSTKGDGDGDGDGDDTSTCTRGDSSSGDGGWFLSVSPTGQLECVRGESAAEKMEVAEVQTRDGNTRRQRIPISPLDGCSDDGGGNGNGNDNNNDAQKSVCVAALTRDENTEHDTTPTTVTSEASIVADAGLTDTGMTGMTDTVQLTPALSQEEVLAFAREGFLRLPRACPPAIVRAAGACVFGALGTPGAIVAGGDGSNTLRRGGGTKLAGSFTQAPQLRQLLSESGRGVRAAAQLLGGSRRGCAVELGDVVDLRALRAQVALRFPEAALQSLSGEARISGSGGSSSAAAGNAVWASLDDGGHAGHAEGARGSDGRGGQAEEGLGESCEENQRGGGRGRRRQRRTSLTAGVRWHIDGTRQRQYAGFSLLLGVALCDCTLDTPTSASSASSAAPAATSSSNSARTLGGQLCVWPRSHWELAALASLTDATGSPTDFRRLVRLDAPLHNYEFYDYIDGDETRRARSAEALGIPLQADGTFAENGGLPASLLVPLSQPGQILRDGAGGAGSGGSASSGRGSDSGSSGSAIEDSGDGVALSLRAGDCVLLHPMTAHAAAPNHRGDYIRSMVYFRLRHRHQSTAPARLAMRRLVKRANLRATGGGMRANNAFKRMQCDVLGMDPGKVGRAMARAAGYCDGSSGSDGSDGNGGSGGGVGSDGSVDEGNCESVKDSFDSVCRAFFFDLEGVAEAVVAAADASPEATHEGTNSRRRNECKKDEGTCIAAATPASVLSSSPALPLVPSPVLLLSSKAVDGEDGEDGEYREQSMAESRQRELLEQTGAELVAALPASASELTRSLVEFRHSLRSRLLLLSRRKDDAGGTRGAGGIHVVAVDETDLPVSDACRHVLQLRCARRIVDNRDVSARLSTATLTYMADNKSHVVHDPALPGSRVSAKAPVIAPAVFVTGSVDGEGVVAAAAELLEVVSQARGEGTGCGGGGGSRGGGAVMVGVGQLFAACDVVRDALAAGAGVTVDDPCACGKRGGGATITKP